MDQRATLEMIAPSVDEAVQNGLEQLGLSRDRVHIEVLDEGGGGLFGFGGRQARVRLTVLGEGEAAEPAHEERKTPRREPRPEPTDAELEDVASIAKATVQELLQHMGIHADVETRVGVSEEGDRSAPVIVDIKGNDLSILIGRDAETLNALQLITRMIVGKEVGHSAHLIVDVESYRERREENLRELARRMANQAVRTGRRQSLEPMTPAERRIIHLELRENDEVSTESAGQDPKRKVVIIPQQS
ncbi:MAG: KH domain-containing protein [Chloroflexi bacterium]|nr:KH domain-containing protein [Chloroflexota bacterium]